jgi:hypothetical protein
LPIVAAEFGLRWVNFHLYLNGIVNR